MSRFQIGFCSLLCLLSGCATSSQEVSRVNAPLVEEPYRLSADREAFAEIRQQIPEGQQQDNDERAFLQQLMADPEVPPTRIREQFNTALGRKRSAFNKNIETLRRDFVTKERADREAFSKDQSQEREHLRGRKLSPNERKEKFSDIEQKRRVFYEGQRERRDAFEADIRDRRKNFEDYSRQVTADFNQEHRNYTRRFEDFQKIEKERKKLEEAEHRRRLKEAEDEFKKMDLKPAEPLEAG